MKRVTREEWVAALRSGEYQQTQAYLYADGTDDYKHNDYAVPAGNCCLGVACVLAGEDLTTFNPDQLSISSFTPDIEEDLMVSLNLTLKEIGELAKFNDDGETFAEIADRIEQNRILED